MMLYRLDLKELANEPNSALCPHRGIGSQKLDRVSQVAGWQIEALMIRSSPDQLC